MLSSTVPSLFLPDAATNFRQNKNITGDHSKQDLRYTQKPIYSPIFTNNAWSHLLWSPVIVKKRTPRVLGSPPHCTPRHRAMSAARNTEPRPPLPPYSTGHPHIRDPPLPPSRRTVPRCSQVQNVGAIKRGVVEKRERKRARERGREGGSEREREEASDRGRKRATEGGRDGAESTRKAPTEMWQSVSREGWARTRFEATNKTRPCRSGTPHNKNIQRTNHRPRVDTYDG